MTKLSAKSNSLGINLRYRYYLRLELLTEDFIRTFKANTVKLTVWMGDRFPHNFQHQVFKPKLPWETKTLAKYRKKGIFPTPPWVTPSERSLHALSQEGVMAPGPTRSLGR